MYLNPKLYGKQNFNLVEQAMIQVIANLRLTKRSVELNCC